MKTYDWTKAQAVVDAYLDALKENHILRLGRSWMEIQMAKLGLVESWRDWQFMESHAAWYACLIRTKSIGKVTKAESDNQHKPSATSKTIRKIRYGAARGTPVHNLLEEMLAQ